MEHQEYPHMLYRDGVVSDTDYMIVGDPGEEAAAAKDGYLRAGANADDGKPIKKAAK